MEDQLTTPEPDVNACIMKNAGAKCLGRTLQLALVLERLIGECCMLRGIEACYAEGLETKVWCGSTEWEPLASTSSLTGGADCLVVWDVSLQGGWDLPKNLGFDLYG